MLQRRVSELLLKRPYGRQNQTSGHSMFGETSAMKSECNVRLTFAMLHCVEIAFFSHLF